MIRRLVEKQDVRVVEEQPRKTEACPLATGKRGHLSIAQCIEPEPSKDSADGRLEVIAAGMLELMLSFGIPLEELLVSGPKTRLELMHLGLELAQMRGRTARVLFNRPGGLEKDLLLHEADARAAGDRHVSRVGGVEARRDAQQGGLPHPVRPHETDAVSMGEAERHLADHKPFTAALRDRLDREDAHARGARWQRGQWNVPRPPTTVRTIGRPQRGHGSPAREYTWNSRCMRPLFPRAST